ncbi:MAG: FAD-dependent oxidoreductase [Planctomycetes bacterium]|nr:FAD-dependent oxidoreductase [Planctomycetota bacterium]
MSKQDIVTVPAQDVPVSGEYDVVVCGGGPAGIGAAIGAAREGVQTLLIEALSSVGGMATGAFVGAWMDSPGGPVFDELLKRMLDIGAAENRYDPVRHHKPGRYGFHCETHKPVALKMVKESGADVLLCTMAEGAWMNDGQVAGVFIANKGGRSLVKAKTVIDCTADGEIAASAGAEFMQGDPEDGRIQHVNFHYRIEGVDSKRFQQEKPSDEELIKLFKNALADGRLHAPPGVRRPLPDSFPFHEPEGELCLTGWEIEKVDPSDPQVLSDTLVECQLIAFDLVQLCRAHLPGYEDARVGRFPALLGTRESRRIVGEYVLTRDDVLAARKFEDGIAKACFFMDLHDSPPGVSIPFEVEYIVANRPDYGDWYEIPYRCLVPKGVKGLLVAGRCVSCDRSAQGSLRVMPTCMFTGEAAGIAGAVAVGKSVLPHQVDGRDVGGKLGL